MLNLNNSNISTLKSIIVYAIYIKYMYLCAFNNKHTNMRFLFYISEIVSCIYIIR